MLSMFLHCVGVHQDVVQKKSRTKTSRYPSRTSLIICMICKGALVTPNGITRNSYKPQCNLNAIFRMSCSRIDICQYPNFKSILLTLWRQPDGPTSLLIMARDTDSGLLSYSVNGSQCKTEGRHLSSVRKALVRHTESLKGG